MDQKLCSKNALFHGIHGYYFKKHYSLLLTQFKPNLSPKSHWVDFASELKYDSSSPKLLWLKIKPSIQCKPYSGKLYTKK